MVLAMLSVLPTKEPLDPRENHPAVLSTDTYTSEEIHLIEGQHPRQWHDKKTSLDMIFTPSTQADGNT